MHTAIPQTIIQTRILEKNEKNWADKGQAIQDWKDEVERWEAHPQKWLAADANPYRRRGRRKPLIFRFPGTPC
jgi:hypothetical protein